MQPSLGESRACKLEIERVPHPSQSLPFLQLRPTSEPARSIHTRNAYGGVAVRRPTPGIVLGMGLLNGAPAH